MTKLFSVRLTIINETVVTWQKSGVSGTICHRNGPRRRPVALSRRLSLQRENLMLNGFNKSANNSSHKRRIYVLVVPLESGDNGLFDKTNRLSRQGLVFEKL